MGHGALGKCPRAPLLLLAGSSGARPSGPPSHPAHAPHPTRAPVRASSVSVCRARHSSSASPIVQKGNITSKSPRCREQSACYRGVSWSRRGCCGCGSFSTSLASSIFPRCRSGAVSSCWRADRRGSCRKALAPGRRLAASWHKVPRV